MIIREVIHERVQAARACNGLCQELDRIVLQWHNRFAEIGLEQKMVWCQNLLELVEFQSFAFRIVLWLSADGCSELELQCV